ncbi:MAG: ester cyclase [Paracoccaceae bacterium]
MDGADRFSSRWPDFRDYIVDITKEIWDDRRILTLHDYYAPDVIVRRPSGVTIGVENVIRETYEAVAQTPVRGAGAEDVIWSRDGTGHFHSSHRCCDRSVHGVDDMHGPATGTQLRYWLVADCAARDDVIDDEWLISDTGAVTRQLGREARDFAAMLIEAEGGAAHCSEPLTAATDVQGPYKGTGNDDEWGRRLEDVLSRVMDGDLSVLLEAHDDQSAIHFAGGREGHGPHDANSFWAGLRASFPRATFEVRHRVGRHDPLLSPRAAIRWTLQGKHEGWGHFGRPTGADVYVMGITHAEFGPWGLRREWTVYDEVQIWKQILMQGAG